LARKDKLVGLIEKQIRAAIHQADILIFVCDAKSGITPLDLEISQLVRRTNKRVILAVNKVDNETLKEACLDFYQLGIGEPYPISAMHGVGVENLLNIATKQLTPTDEFKEADIKIAIVGRPNAGKSSFLNFLLKQERVIVDDKPGTTRDSVDTHFSLSNTSFLLIDTAGITHKKKLKDSASFYSVSRSYQSIRRSDICIVLIDGFEGLRIDDLKILDYICKQQKGCVVAINKWDLVKNLSADDYKELLQSKANFVRFAPVVFTSALEGRNIAKTINLAKNIFEIRKQRLDTKRLNNMLTSLKYFKPFVKGAKKSKKINLKFITQTNIEPPTFLIFTNDATAARKQLGNFIENRIRERFDFTGTPIKIEFRKSSE